MLFVTYHQDRRFVLEREDFPIKLLSVSEFDKNTYAGKFGIDIINLPMINIGLMFSQLNETYQEIKKSSEIYNNIIDNNVELIEKLSERIPGCIEAFNQLKYKGVMDKDKNLCVEKLFERLMDDMYVESNGILLVEVSNQTITSFEEEVTIEKRDIKYVDAYIQRFEIIDLFDNLEKGIDVLKKYQVVSSIILKSLNHIIEEIKKNN